MPIGSNNSMECTNLSILPVQCHPPASSISLQESAHYFQGIADGSLPTPESQLLLEKRSFRMNEVCALLVNSMRCARVYNLAEMS